MLILAALFLTITIPVHISWHRDLERWQEERDRERL
tara:strand:+ start:1503 stop:1610 length:108 start_codon:yes stop_codon:yes gene_type:complete